MALNFSFEQKKNSTAVITTVAIHLLLLLFFLFYKFSGKLQASPEPMGLEVNLGTSDNGSGDDQPEAIGYPADLADARMAATAGNQSKIDAGKIDAGDDALAAPVSLKDKKGVNNNSNSTSRTKPAPNANSAPNTNTPRQAKYTYSGGTGIGNGNQATRNNPGGSEGIGTGNGDQGVPGGTVGASNYSGKPGKGGVSFALSNRHLVAYPDPNATFNEGGKVVFSITVNKDGEIISYQVQSAANATVRALAIAKIKSVRFNKDANARPEEFGTLTFSFR